MTEQELKQAVVEEATNLRNLITGAEASRLSIRHLRPRNNTQCIYGLLAGHCDNARAGQLMRLAAPVMLPGLYFENIEGEDPIYSGLETFKEIFPKRQERVYGYWSPIEIYIYPKGFDWRFQYEERGWSHVGDAQLEALVGYIKGATDSLTVDML